MARRNVEMNEIVEIIYHWHKGNTVKGRKRSVRVDRKTICKYINVAQLLGVRIKTPPGQEAQVDFGYVRLMYDPRDNSLVSCPLWDKANSPRSMG
jgi:hypothetical protein